MLFRLRQSNTVEQDLEGRRGMEAVLLLYVFIYFFPESTITEGSVSLSPAPAAAVTSIPASSNSVGLSAEAEHGASPLLVCQSELASCNFPVWQLPGCSTSWSRLCGVILEPAASWSQKRQDPLWRPISALWLFVPQSLTWRLFLQLSQWFSKPWQ